MQPGGILWLFPGAPLPELEEVLFIPVSTAHQRLWEGWSYTLEEAAQVSGVREVKPLSEWAGFWRRHLGLVKAVYLDFNEHERQTAGQLPTPAHRFARRLQQEHPAHRIERLAPLLYRLRMKKSPEEITRTREAIAITQEAYQRILPLLREGLYEYELEAEILYVFTRNRAVPAFPSIIAGGERACVLHYTFNSQPLRAGELVLIDMGARYGWYAADLTRTLPVGEVDTEKRRYLTWVAEVQRYAQTVLKPGISLHEWHTTVATYIREGLLSLGLLSRDESPDAYKRYFPHGLGHFLGLDVHDVGYRYEPLEAGMVVTCEPGLYIPQKGTGIRIENDLLLTENGCENLSAALPDLLGL
jgi:Xaa-Pro aminopeptidase